MDRLTLRSVSCRCRIGVPKRERRKEQTILVDATLELDLRRAGKSDDIEHSIDYQCLEKTLRAAAQSCERKLLEKLAEDLAQTTLSFDRRVRAVTLRVRKSPTAMFRTRDVTIEIRRTRG